MQYKLEKWSEFYNVYRQDHFLATINDKIL